MDVNGLLLAAGMSTRLHPLSQERPKPLFPVGNQTLLQWSLGLLKASGITALAINLHHLGHQIRAALQDGRDHGVSIRYSPEPEILGTGGGIKALGALMPRVTSVVVNAKIIVDLDLRQVLAFHRRSGALATMVVRPDANAERWGPIGVDSDQRVARILEHWRPGAAAGPPPQLYQFTGIQVLEPEFIEAIPARSCCVIRTAYLEHLARGAPIAAYCHNGYFYDHSTLPRYLQGNFNVLEGRVLSVARPSPPDSIDPAAILAPDGIDSAATLAPDGIDPTATVAPDATLIGPVLIGAQARIASGARLGPRVIVGQGASIGRGVALEDVVVWPGAEVDQSARRAVITEHGIVAVPAVADPTAQPR